MTKLKCTTLTMPTSSKHTVTNSKEWNLKLSLAYCFCIRLFKLSTWLSATCPRKASSATVPQTHTTTHKSTPSHCLHYTTMRITSCSLNHLRPATFCILGVTSKKCWPPNKISSFYSLSCLVVIGGGGVVVALVGVVLIVPSFRPARWRWRVTVESTTMSSFAGDGGRRLCCFIARMMVLNVADDDAVAFGCCCCCLVHILTYEQMLGTRWFPCWSTKQERGWAE